MKRFCLLFLICFAAIGCKKPLCSRAEHYVDAMADMTGILLQCQNTDAIKDDLKKKIEELNLCTTTPTGLASAMICHPISRYVTTEVVKSLPSQWECKGGIAAGGLEAALYHGCTLLPF